MLLRAFIRFVAEIEDSAMVAFIWSFSASRLKGLRLLDFLSLSFFFLSLEEDPKKDPEPDEERP